MLCKCNYSTELHKIEQDYEKKLEKRNKSDKAMFALAWQVEELQKLCAEYRLLQAEICVIVDLLTNPLTDFYQINLPQCLAKLREWLLTVVKAAYLYKR